MAENIGEVGHEPEIHEGFGIPYFNLSTDPYLMEREVLGWISEKKPRESTKEWKKIVDGLLEDRYRNFLALSRREVLKEAIAEGIEVSSLRSGFLPDVVYCRFAERRLVCMDGERVVLVSPMEVNPITSWYSDYVYRNLPRVLMNAEAKLGKGLLLQPFAENVAILGFLNGNLEDDNNQGAEAIRILKGLVDVDEMPRVIKDLFAGVTEEKVDWRGESKKLKMLKDYWPCYFRKFWLTRAMMEIGGKKVMSKKDIAEFEGKEGVRDLRVVESVGMAERLAYNQIMRGNPSAKQKPVIDANTQEFWRNNQMLENKIGVAKLELVKHTDLMLREFNPKHVGLKDREGRLAPDWVLFRDKVGYMFEKMMKVDSKQLIGAGIEKYECRQVMEELAEAMKEVLAGGESGRRLELEKLFGENFLELSSTEQVMLMVYTGLSVDTIQRIPTRQIFLVVQMVSERLAPFLEKYTKPMVSEKPEEVPEFVLENYIKRSEDAKRKLEGLRLKDGLVGALSREVREEFKVREKIFEEADKMSKRLLFRREVGRSIKGLLLTAVAIAATVPVTREIDSSFFQTYAFLGMSMLLNYVRFLIKQAEFNERKKNYYEDNNVNVFAQDLKKKLEAPTF